MRFCFLVAILLAVGEWDILTGGVVAAKEQDTTAGQREEYLIGTGIYDMYVRGSLHSQE